MSKTSGKISNSILALAAGTIFSVGGMGYLIKDKNGQPIAQSMLFTQQAPESEIQPAPDDTAQSGDKQPEDGQQEQIASLPDQAENQEADLQPLENEAVPKQETQAPVGTENSAEPPTDPASQEDAIVSEPVSPSIDLMRVEKDGSVVIAGKAEPGSTVEVLEGDIVVAEGKSGSSGDFAIVFDTPLKPGGHSLELRSKSQADPENENDQPIVPLYSTQRGIINIPQSDESSGEVLAMIDELGAPSRIVITPRINSQNGADAEPSVTQSQAVENEPSAQESEVASLDEAVQAAHDDSVQPGSQPPALAPTVTVKAVDVEEGRVFIAGVGTPEHMVSVYINNQHKGMSRIGPEGAFLFEMGEGLAIGNHNLRVDLLKRNSAEVSARVAVILDNSETQLAAAEPAADQTDNAGNEPEQVTSPEIDEVAEIAEVTEQQDSEVSATEDTVSAANGSDEPGEAVSIDFASNETEAADETAQAQSEALEVEAPTPNTDEADVSSEAQISVALATQSEETQAATNELQEGSSVESGQAEEAQLPVIKAGRSVIIRRGDNLWKISRRMLGAGRKYTLIFSANANQIDNPHRIYPGQVFDVPDQGNTESDTNSGDAG